MKAEDGADVWMVQRRRELGFAFEPSQVGSTVGQIRRQHLDARGAIECRVENLVNGALATFADFFDDTIMEEELPDHGD